MVRGFSLGITGEVTVVCPFFEVMPLRFGVLSRTVVLAGVVQIVVVREQGYLPAAIATSNVHVQRSTRFPTAMTFCLFRTADLKYHEREPVNPGSIFADEYECEAFHSLQDRHVQRPSICQMN